MILKEVKVLCFDTLLQVFILKILRAQKAAAKWGILCNGFILKELLAEPPFPRRKAYQEIRPAETTGWGRVGLPGTNHTFTYYLLYVRGTSPSRGK
jgi:hypothetical protein